MQMTHPCNIFRLEPENIVDYHEWNENEWKQNDFNKNVPEKDVKKRKVTKIAFNHEDEVSNYYEFKKLSSALSGLSAKGNSGKTRNYALILVKCQ